MTESIGAIEKLTMPPELQGNKVPETVVSLDLRHREGESVDLVSLANAAGLIEKVYSSVAQVYRRDGGGQLRILKIESGSSIRFDCKGLADAVKHFKDFLLEAWHKVQYHRAEEISVNNEAVLSSLGVLKELAKREQSGEVPPEGAALLRRAIVDSTLGLLQAGVLPTEVATVEVVDNTAFARQL